MRELSVVEQRYEVVRAVMVQEQPGPQRRLPPGDRVPDPVPPAHPGDQGGPPGQRERIAPELAHRRFVLSHVP